MFGALWGPSLGLACIPAQATEEVSAKQHTAHASSSEVANVADAAPTPSSIQPLSAQARTEDERNTIDVFKVAAPATVFVTQNRVFRDFWSRRSETVPAGSGTGFIWDNKGHIVTNAHVVGDERSRGIAQNASFEVTLFDGKRYPAKLVGIAQKKDIAVLRIDPQGVKLSPIQLPPKSTELEVGQKTLAIGNPFGLDHTLTTGVISALGREVVGFGGVTIRDMIQTDASINPGNSGGPLLNSAGQLIGINTMIYSKTGSSAGIGFAVPIPTVRRLVPQLIAYGQPRQVGLGVLNADDAIARRLGVTGVIVIKVVPGSPAAKAGLRDLREDRQRGNLYFDVIVGIDGEPIRNYDDLYNALDPHEPGKIVQVKVQRGNKIVTLPIALTVISDLDPAN